MDEPTLNAIVTLRNQVSPWLMVLQVVPDGWELPEFVSGQAITLGLPGSASRCDLAEPENSPADPDKLIRHMYSIASSPVNRLFLEFYIALVPDGKLTPRLFNLKIGDRIWMSEKAAGTFTLEQVPQDADVILVATSSGLAPYISMLSTHLKVMGKRRVAVLHSVRHSWDLGYRSILMTMQHLRDNFTYVPLVSRLQQEPVPWQGAAGHIQDLWKNGTMDRIWGFHPTPENTHIFLCGGANMIEEMAALLAQDGFKESTPKDPGQIHAARWWKKAVG
ncbi:ferredoxin--NADP reductase [Planctomycetota bacterium]